MIKIILTFTLILLFVPSIVKAQLQLGVKAGMNVSNAEVKDFVNWLVTDYKPSVGINLEFSPRSK